ncbi:helix-turn-helix domain-containing protein [Klebsiella pneumoniae]
MTSIYSNDYRLGSRALGGAQIACGITQQEVASAFGRPQSFIAKVESGERRLDVVEFVRLCRLLNIEPASILNKLQ